MAESSSSSTSENPQIERVGFALPTADTSPSDPNNSTPQIVEIHHSASPETAPDGVNDSPTEAVEETADVDEDVELLNAIQRDLCRLTLEQAEIERGETVGEEKGNDLTVQKGDRDEENEGKDSESVEDQHENEGRDEDSEGRDDEDNEGRDDEDNEENAASKSRDGFMQLGRYDQSNQGRRINYPMRPDAEDCAFYMKFGSCKFGLNCKFNHPPWRKNQGVKERANQREENLDRAGQTECKYYLTSGGCKYGKDCKYSHGSDKSLATHTPEFNFLGLPIRIGEKECPYYMRTGSCKYGSNCRFHHPEPVTVGDSPSGYGNGGSVPSQHVSSSSAPSWTLPRAFNEISPFVPVIYPPSQGDPTSNQEWDGYQAATYRTSERSLPTPPAFAMNNLTAEISFPMHHQHDIIVEEYPERPGEPECSFFLKTGDCKFKSSCKFHHPKNRVSKAKANSYALNDKGLPLRPDQPICTHYHRYGICKYGPACKYDHPSNFAILPTPFDQPPFGKSNVADGAMVLGKGNGSS